MTRGLLIRVALAVLVSAPGSNGARAAAQTGGRVRAPHAAFGEALGVTCSHCHVDGDWASAATPAFATARNMMRMVDTLNATLLASTRGIACLTCHRGQTRPPRVPGAAIDAALAAWPASLASASEDRRLAMAVYSASLGVSCDYCHDIGDWAAADKQPHRMVATMSALFEEFPKFMPPAARTQCFMCHQGKARPTR